MLAPRNLNASFCISPPANAKVSAVQQVQVTERVPQVVLKLFAFGDVSAGGTLGACLLPVCWASLGQRR